MILKKIVLSYPNLWEKNAGPKGDSTNPAWDTGILLDKDDPQVKLVQKAIDNCGIEKFGKAWDKLRKAVAGTDHDPLKDGDNKLDKNGDVRPEYAGKVYLKAKSTKKRPKLLNRAKEPIPATEDGINEIFYGGVIADVEIDAYAYDFSGKRSVSFSLVQVRSHERGDAFGGSAPSSADAFDDLDDEDEDDDLI